MRLKTPFLLAVLACGLAGVLLVPPATSAEEDDIAPHLAAIQEQQNTITENQKKIDERIAAVAEEVRLARIFVSRGGGGKKAP